MTVSCVNVTSGYSRANPCLLAEMGLTEVINIDQSGERRRLKISKIEANPK